MGHMEALGSMEKFWGHFSVLTNWFQSAGHIWLKYNHSWSWLEVFTSELFLLVVRSPVAIFRTNHCTLKSLEFEKARVFSSMFRTWNFHMLLLVLKSFSVQLRFPFPLLLQWQLFAAELPGHALPARDHGTGRLPQTNTSWDGHGLIINWCDQENHEKHHLCPKFEHFDDIIMTKNSFCIQKNKVEWDLCKISLSSQWHLSCVTPGKCSQFRSSRISSVTLYLTSRMTWRSRTLAKVDTSTIHFVVIPFLIFDYVQLNAKSISRIILFLCSICTRQLHHAKRKCLLV